MSVRIGIHIHVSVCVYVYMKMCTCIAGGWCRGERACRLIQYVYMCVCMYEHIYINIWQESGAAMSVRAGTHKYVYVCMYMYV